MKRTFRFDKLVRDDIPDDQRREGSDVVDRRLNDQEYLAALREKLLEESREITFDNAAEAAKELADLQEVIDCMAGALGVSKELITEEQATKRQKAGSFKSRLYVETVTVDDMNPWIEHYLANPDRYPEIVDQA